MEPTNIISRERIDYLDSLRGIAACQVVASHALGIFEVFYSAKHHGPITDPWVRLLTDSPLHLFWDGSEAVIFFFVLSGFVLALPYVRGDGTPYAAYVARRFCRIYLPYIGIIFLSSILLLFNLNHHLVEGAATHFADEWARPVSLREAGRLLLMNGDWLNVDKVDWSLTIEMRISLIFPLLVWVVMRLGLGWNLVGALGISLLATFSRDAVHPLGGAFYYAIFFVFGAVLANYRIDLTRILSTWKSWKKFLWVPVVIFFYNAQWEFWAVPLLRGRDELVCNWMVGIASVLVIMAALAFPSFQSFLRHPSLLWIGKRSYSLYLLHAIVLLTAVHYLPQAIPLPGRVLLGVFLSVPAAGLCYQFLEEPCQSLGYRLSKKIRTWIQPAAESR